MLCTLRLIDEEVCFAEYHKCIWIIGKSMGEGFINTIENLDFKFLMCFLGQKLFEAGRPNARQKKAGQVFVGCITSNMIKKSIIEGTPRNWHTFYRFFSEIVRYDAQKLIMAIKDIDFNILNLKTADMWEEQTDVLIELLFMLFFCNKVKAEEWIYSNKDKIRVIDTAIIQLSPRTTEYVLNNGRAITLTKSHRWNISANAVLVLRLYNKKMCYKIVEDSIDDIKQSLYDLSDIDWAKYYLFLRQLLMVNKGIIDVVISDKDVPLIEERWNRTFEKVYYKNQKKDLQGFYKLTNIIKEKSDNPLLIGSVRKISKKIDGIIKSLKPLKY
jgi:hypothetical protein